jgi:hypothetical protein
MALLATISLFYALSVLSGGLLAILVVYFLINEIIRYRARINNLAGPRGLPVIGNLYQVSAPISLFDAKFKPPYRSMDCQRPKNTESGQSNTVQYFKSNSATSQL